MQFFLFFAHPRVFTDEPQSPFWLQNPKQAWWVFERCQFWPSVKPLKLFLPEKNSIKLDFALSETQCKLILFYFLLARLPVSSDVRLSRFRLRNLKVFLINFEIVLVSALL